MGNLISNVGNGQYGTRKPLIAVKNSANGGVGVSYSNVLLSGGINPQAG